MAGVGVLAGLRRRDAVAEINERGAGLQEGQAEATTGRQGLSQTKRASHFDALTDEEIERIETIVAEHMARRSFATSG